MKRILTLIIILQLAFVSTFSQEVGATHIPLIGEIAPKFTAESTLGPITFPDDNNSKWTILFSHPADFTAVCSTEILELARMQEEFEKLNTRIMVISTDAVSSHIEWVKSLESLRYKDSVPIKIKFPLISDKSLEISRKYGMIHANSSTTKDVRGVFIISPDDKIAAIIFYPMNVGRNLEEVKRVLEALQTSEKHNVLMPANWTPGQDVMLPSPKTSTEVEKSGRNNEPDLYSISWYMWFRKMRP